MTTQTTSRSEVQAKEIKLIRPRNAATANTSVWHTDAVLALFELPFPTT